jgi:hypothetical protein
VGEEAPSATATHHVEDSGEDLTQGVHPRASGSSGSGKRGFMQTHSASERSVSGMLFSSCPVSYPDTASEPLFRRFLKDVAPVSYVRVGDESQPSQSGS